MKSIRKIHVGLTLSIATALGILAGSASAGPPGSLDCTMSGATATGREWAIVYRTKTPGVCKRERVGGSAPIDFSSCHQRARDDLGCTIVVD